MPSTCRIYKFEDPAALIFSIIDRYLLQETLKGLATILSVLLLILVGHAFISNLQRVVAGVLTNEVILGLLGFEVLRVLGVLIPAAFFFAILYTLGRMYRDSEMTALAACGVSTARIYRAFLFSAIPLTLLVTWLAFWVLPWANQSIDEIRSVQKAVANMANVSAGRFNEYSQGDLVFYVEELSSDQVKMRNVFVQNRQHGKLGLINANEGYQEVDTETGEHFVVLTDGRRYVGLPGQPDYTVTRFEKYSLRLQQPEGGKTKLRRKSKSSKRLWKSKNIKDRAEFQYRLAFPLAVIVFTLISVPLSRSLPRQGIYGRLFLAFVVYFTFFNLLGVSGTWMEKGVTPEWMGRWWVHLLLLLMVAPLVLRDSPWGTSLKQQVIKRLES